MSRADLRPLLTLVAALLVTRVLFIVLMPPVYSMDLFSWLHVMDVLQSGGNPYKETEVLNWPPFWMQILFGIHQFCNRTNLNPIHAVQAVLIFGEIAVLCMAYFFGRKWLDARRLFIPLLFGLAINPVSIFLSCQHCNYDVFVGLFILAGIGMLMMWHRTEQQELWLAACFLIGLGILAKTVPIMLTPLLLTGIRKLSWPMRLFGVLLAAAPFLIGMSVLFSLEPHGVMQNVIGYRSMGGWYGFSGILWTAGASGALHLYKDIAPLLMLGALLVAGWKSLCFPTDSLGLLVRAILLMLFVTTFGPGYTPPYILWYLPLLVLLFALSDADAGLRRLLWWGWIVTIGTYTIEYAFFDSHGAFIKAWWHWEKVAPICERLGSRPMQTLIRLPMFLLYLALFFRLLRGGRRAPLLSEASHESPQPALR